jgi:hypothetical protein
MLLGSEACGLLRGGPWLLVGLVVLALALDPLLLGAWCWLLGAGPRSCAYGVAGRVRGLTTTCYGAARCVRGLRG